MIEAPAEGFVANVAGDRYGLAAFLADEIDHLLGVRLLDGKIVDGHVGALARIGDGGRPADAGIAACDQRPPAGEAARALVARLTVIGTWIHAGGEARPGLLLAREGRPRIFRARVGKVWSAARGATGGHIWRIGLR
jgi:hypothetical protein